MCPCVFHSLKIGRVCTYFTSKQGKRLASSMKRGSRMNLMKPVWDEGLVTLSRSMKGVTGRPSSFSTSLWGRKRRNYSWVQVFKSLCILYNYLVVKLLQKTVQPGLGHLHGPGLIGNVTHFDQNHHQLHTQHQRGHIGAFLVTTMPYHSFIRCFIHSSCVSNTSSQL